MEAYLNFLIVWPVEDDLIFFLNWQKNLIDIMAVNLTIFLSNPPIGDAILKLLKLIALWFFLDLIGWFEKSGGNMLKT